MKRDLRRVFAIPACLAAASAVGLLAALLGDGAWDVLSWIMLGIPVAVALWYATRPPVLPPEGRRSAREL